MPALLTVEDYLARVLTLGHSPRRVETVPLDAALGRVLAVDVAAAVSVPPFDNSAMDGYAVRAADRLPNDGRVTWADHDGDRFVAGVEVGALSSTQFHPEKSGQAGAALLRNWIATLG